MSLLQYIEGMVEVKVSQNGGVAGRGCCNKMAVRLMAWRSKNSAFPGRLM
jgi:hypothetical protein